MSHPSICACTLCKDEESFRKRAARLHVSPPPCDDVYIAGSDQAMILYDKFLSFLVFADHAQDPGRLLELLETAYDASQPEANELLDAARKLVVAGAIRRRPELGVPKEVV